MENMEDILMCIIGILLGTIIVLIITLVNTTTGITTDENCTYYQNNIYCDWERK